MLSKLLVSTSLTLVTYASTNDELEIEEDAYIYHSSCLNLDDGEHTLKLLDGDLSEFPLVNVECNNGYTILDVSKDDDLIKYFNTFQKYHRSVAGPTNNVLTNWEGWYLPDDGLTNYIISPDCNSCDDTHIRQIHKNDENGIFKTTYMMTGTMFGCFWNLKGEHNFDQDYDTYQCYYTSGEINEIGQSIRNELGDESSEDEWNESGVCAFSVRESNRLLPSPMTHDACTVDFDSLTNDPTDSYHLKPSIGTDGEFCVCVKPYTSHYYSIDADDADEFLSIKETRQQAAEETETEAEADAEKDNEDTTETSEEYELYQSDFEDGTYRILTSGTYKIMEDIIFDFNADYENPNSGGAWWPHEDQQDKYPGAGGYHDAYFLGFFAGITIECNDVIIDLNGYELKMSDHFYWQQRWFTIISLQSQYFLPGQGIGFFGADPKFAENVVIKDGVLGLTSHHGIHGHFNKNIEISNVQIKEFETHGIQFNGFDGIVISNCEIGPTAAKSYFKGEYGHARTLLPRFQQIADEYPNEILEFYGRNEKVTMQDIVDELHKQVDMAYYYVSEGRQYDEDDESWQSAKQLFIDVTAYPNGAAMYGIFLNTYGASVLTYNLYTSFYSNNAVIENVSIHGLRHSMTEYVRMSVPDTGNLYMNPLHAPFDATHILESVSDFSAPRYKGNVLTDAVLAMEKLAFNNWDLLQASLIIDNRMLDWAFGQNDNGMNNVAIGCNTDVMIHSGKGINGLRIDGVENVEISNIEIYDIIEHTPMGRMECGHYAEYKGGDCTGACGGHFRQTKPMQIGFSGNMLQGININAAKDIKMKDINIYNLESKNGAVYGVSIWPGVHATMEGTVSTAYLKAGTDIELGRLKKYYRPNASPEVCGVRVYSSYTANNFEYRANVDIYHAKEVYTSCLYGDSMCMGSDSKKSSVGTYSDDDEEELCDWSQFGAALEAQNEDVDVIVNEDNEAESQQEEEEEEEVEAENSEKKLSHSDVLIKLLAVGDSSGNIGNIGSIGNSGDVSDSTKTTNDTYSKMFNNNMIYLMAFLAISMIAIIGGKFIQEWFPAVDYVLTKRYEESIFSRNNRLNRNNNNNISHYGTTGNNRSFVAL